MHIPDSSKTGHDTTKELHRFNEHEVLHELKHYLPAQAPLKDFIHHNTLHAFQKEKFFDALAHASTMLGYTVFLPLGEYRSMYSDGRILPEILDKIIKEEKGQDQLKTWKEKALNGQYDSSLKPRIGALRENWKKQFHIDLDADVHSTLFRVLCCYLDQGIAAWKFPVRHKGFLESLKELEANSISSIFKKARARNLLINGQHDISNLLRMLVGEERYYKQYLYDQQFAHQGWSGITSAVEDQPQTLLDERKISLHDLVVFELLLEIDALDDHFGNIWSPLSHKLPEQPVDLFAPPEKNELHEVLQLLHSAYEWSYYEQVLTGIQVKGTEEKVIDQKSFQAMFCIDDREGSLRRYLENIDPNCETFGTPGFFGVEFYFQPEHGKFYTKLCPAPVNPKYLIKESGTSFKKEKDAHFTKSTHGLLGGWLISQTLGYWSALRLFLNIFNPKMGAAAASSFKHMDRFSNLTIEHKQETENGLQIGFTIEEMANRVEGLLKSIGLVKNFAPLVYAIGHGSSSVNNPHYAAYDCGACSGRPGSVNARVISYMANHPAVRVILRERGIDIPDTTRFVGALHDTTRDEIAFYDEQSLGADHVKKHLENLFNFEEALSLNAKERSRRLESINTCSNPEKIHHKIRERSVSLFEPRPELNHATNALCIVGRRELSWHLFLDRRSFMNSYHYKVDPEGKYLFNILKAAAPVCGGINLEYFFSRVDNQKLGAGTKLPHNVMGLFGVANGIEGDLRPGLPSQMIEVHDPVRLLIIVEQDPDIVMNTIKISAETYEWFINEWVHLVAIHPETRELFRFKDGRFHAYNTLPMQLKKVKDIPSLIESSAENLPVCLIH